jgi:hypothetical protein
MPVNAPAAGVVPPIGVLLIVPPERVGDVTVGLVNVLFVSVWVPLVVATVAPPAVAAAGSVAVPVTFSVPPTVAVPPTVSVPATLSVFPEPTLRPTDVPLPPGAKRASIPSRSLFSFVPQESLEAPTSGFVRLRFVVNESAIGALSNSEARQGTGTHPKGDAALNPK